MANIEEEVDGHRSTFYNSPFFLFVLFCMYICLSSKQRTFVHKSHIYISDHSASMTACFGIPIYIYIQIFISRKNNKNSTCLMEEKLYKNLMLKEERWVRYKRTLAFIVSAHWKLNEKKSKCILFKCIGFVHWVIYVLNILISRKAILNILLTRSSFLALPCHSRYAHHR
jgi:hypothetical protein